MCFKADNKQHKIIYRCIIGSQAYGLATEDSDVDRRGFYLPSAELHWSLDGAPAQLEDAGRQECIWEIEKFPRLALVANPTILECLYTPLVELETELATELRHERQRFLSARLGQTFSGYARSQFERFARRRVAGHAIKWKEAMHLLRILLVGISVAEQGELGLETGAWRDELLAVKRGERSWEEVDALRRQLEQRFQTAFATAALPAKPDSAWANAYLIRARRSMVESRHA